MKLWIVSRECAGIAEAGGVKNVTLSLCKEFQQLNHKVTLFIPVYKTNSWKNIHHYEPDYISNIHISHCGKTEAVNYGRAICTEGNFNVIFIEHPAFAEKEAVYTYTENEQKNNPQFIKGTGHHDSLFMDSLFCKAVCEYLRFLKKTDYPDIIHCQDASTALIPSLVREKPEYKNISSVVTIHNAGPAYHHNFSSIGEAAWYTGLNQETLNRAVNNFKVEPFLLASDAGAYLTTVSEKYAEELTDPANDDITEGLASIFFERKINITGIINGIDYERYDAADTSVSLLPFSFDPENGKLEGKTKCKEYLLDQLKINRQIEDLKLFGTISSENINDDIFICYHGRITEQKGINVLTSAIPSILNNFNNVYFLICGQGQIQLENNIIELTERYKGKVIFLNGYNRIWTRLLSASSEFIVMPSNFEPCGLEDFIAQIYGTIPVGNKTGGLNKIVERETGFLYENNTPENFIAKLSEVITIYIHDRQLINKIIKNGVKNIKKNYLWSKVIKNRYLPFFKEILQKNQ